MDQDALIDEVDSGAEALDDAARTAFPAPLLIGALAVAALTAGAVVAWRRRQRAASEHLSGEQEWGAPAAVPEALGVAAEQSPEVTDEVLREEIDEVADEMSTAFVEAVEGPIDEAAHH